MLLGLLRERGRATNRAMIQAIGGDAELFEEVRDDLILDDLAEDKKGVGLVYIGASERVAAAASGEPPGELAAPHATGHGEPLPCPELEGEHRELKIFLSYGHDRFTTDALRIKQDLEARGHQVWFDVERLEAGRDWEHYIEQGLRWCDKVVLLMTPHSVRRRDPRDPESRDGYCLNEIAKAIERNKLIVPVLLVELHDGPPTSICRIQYLDLRDAVPITEREERYRSRFPRLLRAVEEDDLDFEGSGARLARLLKPLRFEAQMARHIARFTGRRWLIADLDRWLVDPAGSRVLWLSGGPGVGKTALAVHLCHTRQEVIAYHLCVHNHQDKADPARAVLSIVYQMAQHLREYERRLQALSLEEEVGKNAETLFDNLIVAPLATDFPTPNGVRLVIIDGLDEATSNGRNALASLIRDHWSDTPPWLRLLVTSRPEAETVASLAAFAPYTLDVQAEENLSDIGAFLEREMTSRGIDPGRALVEAVVSRSQGVFLYATVILDELAAGTLSAEDLDAFPAGLSSYYQRFFGRKLSDLEAYRASLRPVLETICAQRGPLPLHVLSRATGLDEVTLRERTDALGSLFPLFVTGRRPSAEDTISPFHRSIRDWLTSWDERTGFSRAGPYAIDVADGERRLAEVCAQDLSRGVPAASSYVLTHGPAHLAAAARGDDLARVLGDIGYVHAKVAALGPQALVSDYGLGLETPGLLSEAQQRTFSLIQAAVRMSAHILSSDPAQVVGQLTGRLMSSRDPGVQQVLSTARAWSSMPWLRPLAAGLAEAGGPLVRTLAGHRGLVFAVAALLGNTRAVSASWDGTLRLWNLDTGATEHVLRGADDNILALAVTPDGALAVTGSRDGAVSLWDLERAALRCAPAVTPGGYVSAVAVAGDGALIFSGHEDGTIHVWRGRDSVDLQRWKAHDAPVRSLALTPDEERIVSGSSDGAVKVWDTKTGALDKALDGIAGVVYSLSVTPDGQRVISGGEDQRIRVWDLASGREDLLLEGHRREVVATVITPDGTRCVSGSWDKTIRIWDLRTGQEEMTLSAHLREVESVAVTDDGTRLLSASWDGTVKVWDLTSRPEHRAALGHDGDVLGVALSADGARAVSAGADNVVRVWRVDEPAEVRVLGGHTAPVQAVAFSPRGRRVVSGSWDGGLVVWDLESGRQQRTLVGHEGHVLSVLVTPDGKRAVSRSRDRTARVWDLETGESRHVLRGHEESISDVAFVPGKPCAITTSFDRTARVWDLDTGAQQSLLRGHEHWVHAVAVTRDGRIAVTASSDKTLGVWDLSPPGCLLRSLTGHEGGVTVVAFTPDGRRVVSGGFDKTIRIWDLSTGELERVLTGHTHWVNALVCTDDGRLVVSISSDKTVRVWDLETGSSVAVFTGDSAMRCLAVTPDGRRLVVGSKSGPVHFLSLEGLGPGKP